MVSVDELKARFGPALVVAPFGECIVIPGVEFDPDWEVSLGDKGYMCHFTDLDGHAVTLVQLKKAVAEGKAVYVPPEKPAVIPEFHSNQTEVKEVEKVENEENKRVNWQPEEDALLISLWNQGSSIPDIAVKVEEKYPIRKGNSANMRLKRLRIVGQIQPRNKHVREKVAEVEKVEEVEKVAEKSNRGNPRPTMPWLKDAEFWSPEEDALIVELWKKGLTLAEIGVEVNKKYPKRVRYAITGRIYQLQKKGSIEKRHKPKLKAAKSLIVTKGDKSTGKVDVEVLPTSAKYVPFSDIWAFASSRETDLKQRAEAFYKAATGVNLDGNIIGSVITCFEELDALRGLNDNQIDDLQKFSAEINDKLGALQKQLISHKHAQGSSEAMLPMEAST
jgi:hypothetical protein